ncbi:GNAT family N-acetyltransferase [Cellvibrio sp. KY-GH-1]|nr:GNAT family N-acetyltransferase [Cellvibrio sp. KY-GH-1]
MSPGTMSLFRTLAWVQSWVDIWGSHPRVTLIDLGGRRNPLEMVYLLDHRIKGIIPVTSLVVVGNGFADFNLPRAEYNNLDSLLLLAGGREQLFKELIRLPWNQWALTDLSPGVIDESFSALSEKFGAKVIAPKVEVSYRIKSDEISRYKAQLSSSVRAKYFNRKSKLSEYGCIELLELSSTQDFFQLLNEFHRLRWGRPCYSPQSMEFLSLFIERIRGEGGRPIMQLLQVAGETVSVLFDVVWNGVRYNFQSGYFENKFPQIALGSLHFGIAIEQALANGLAYDLLAGTGKNSNYKQKIATDEINMISTVLARGWLKRLYWAYGKK